MGEVDGGSVDGEEAGGGEAFEYGVGVCGVCGVEFGAVDGAPGVLGSFAGSDEAEQNAAGEYGLGGCEGGVGGFGGVGDGAVESVGGVVGGFGEGFASAAAPGFQEGVGHQGQGTGFAVDVLEDAGGQAAFDDQSAGGGGLDDRFPQFVRVHRPDGHGGVAQHGDQVVVFEAPVVEVGPDRDQDAQCGCRGCWRSGAGR